MNIKIETWAGHEIRFVEKKSGEWWAVLADIAKALSLRTDKLISRLRDDDLSKVPILDKIGRLQETAIVNEFGVYEAVFESRKKKAKEFKRWVFDVLHALRKASNLEGFQIFRMLDKEHQKKAMEKLQTSLQEPTKIDYVKANTIANKAVSNLYGFPKNAQKARHVARSAHSTSANLG